VSEESNSCLHLEITEISNNQTIFVYRPLRKWWCKSQSQTFGFRTSGVRWYWLRSVHHCWASRQPLDDSRVEFAQRNHDCTNTVNDGNYIHFRVGLGVSKISVGMTFGISSEQDLNLGQCNHNVWSRYRFSPCVITAWPSLLPFHWPRRVSPEPTRWIYFWITLLGIAAIGQTFLFREDMEPNPAECTHAICWSNHISAYVIR
jgi:hypothetical protein